MSHFSMIVVLDELPTEDVLAKVMAPWHEFECTGLDDEHVQDLDITDDVRKAYEESTDRFVLLSDGERVSKYDDRFYTQEGDTGLLSKKEFVLPEGATEIEVPTPETQTFEEYASGYYGHPIIREGENAVMEEDALKYGHTFVAKDGTVKVTDRTNPNAKWDWYVVGGRWSGLLRSKTGGIKGEPGLMGSEYDPNGVDVCKRANLDLDSMRAERITQREQSFVKALETYNGQDIAIPGITVEDLKKYSTHYSMSVANARRVWEDTGSEGPFSQFIDNSTDANAADIRGLREKFGNLFSWQLDLPEGTADANDWINDAPALSAWGIIKDGQWYEKGAMGWWGMSSDNKPENEWETELHKLILDLPDDKVLAVVDCHI